MKTYRKPEFWVAVLILLLTAVFSAWTFVNWFSLSFFVGDLFFVHWLGIVATVFIAALVPIYYVLKRKRPKSIRLLLKIHVFGYLFSFLLVSIHFAQHTGRLSGFILRLEEGFVLFLVLGVIVATGMIERFGARLKLAKYTKFVHRYLVAVFYLIMVFHVLQFFNII
ncbi:MAG: hypothetical protein PVI43_02145 [Candidatus Bathyarchaeota archaeon]